MKKVNRLIVIFAICILTFLIIIANYKIFAFYFPPQNGTATLTYSDDNWRKDYFCINHNKSLEVGIKHNFTLYKGNRVNYYSDDTSKFKRQIAYLFYRARQSFQTTTNENGYTYYSGLGYGTGYPNYHKTFYQQVLWKILYKNSNGNTCTGDAPFKGESVAELSSFENYNGQSAELAKQLYNDVMNDNNTKSTPCFQNVKVETTDLTAVNNSANMGYFNVTSMNGTSQTVTIKYLDDNNKTQTETISGGVHYSTHFKLLKTNNKDGEVLAVNKIKQGSKVYLYCTKGISRIQEVSLTVSASGWMVTVEKWTNNKNTEQNLLRVVLRTKNEPATATAKIKLKKGSLQIRKQGVEKWNASSSSGENPEAIKASFKIYCVDNQKWLTGNANGEKGYTSDYKNASIYQTTTKVSGMTSITINNMVAGYKYNIYEVDTEDNYKNKDGIPNMVDVAWSILDEQNKTWRRNDGQTKRMSWKDGSKSFPGFGSVSILNGKTKQVDVRNEKIPKEEIDIGIQKVDNSTGNSLSGVGLQFYKLDDGWLSKNNDESVNFVKAYSNATTYITGTDGKIFLKDLKVGTYYIYENKTSPSYSLDYQRIKYPDNADPNKFAGKNEYSNIVYLGELKLTDADKGKKIDNIKYNQYSLNTSLTIQKKDGTLENMPLSGTKIKIYGNTFISNGWINQIKEGEYKFETYENATEFITNDIGEIKLDKIPYGTYYVFETEVADKNHYNIKEQTGYHIDTDEQGNPIPGTNDFSKNADWVYLGKATIGETSEKIKFTAENYTYTSLKGKVWRDIPAYKETTVGDNVYRSNIDELMSGITVNLYNGKDELIAKTTTNNNGEYEFTNKNIEKYNGEKLTYWELASCYVEFIYDNKNYVVVNQFVGEDKTINSKAIEETMTVEELEDDKLTGTKEATKEDLPGKAITYKGGRNLTSNEIIENTNDNNKNLATTPLTGYYNKDTHTIEDINLGLVKKPNQEIYVGENLEYVKITLNGYTYTYKYGDPEVLNSQFVPTVEKQKNKYDFYAKLYPTDVAYDATKDTEELKVYAVYSIGVENPTITQEYDNYYEKKLYLSELNATYDTDRFELSKDEIGDAEENKQFKLWRGENGQAYFNLEETEEKGNVFANGIEPNIQKELNQPSKRKTAHIQFKVKKEIIKQILSDINSVNNTEVPTKVFAKGYHEYLRTDNVWIDNKDVKAYRGVKGTYNDVTNKKYYVHKSTEVKDESCGLYLKFELGEARTISGLVFEDKDEQLNDYERIGNGKYDEGETKLKNVSVSLLNESGNVAKLYNKENNSTTIKDAIAISEDGKYQLSGMLPGKYYLQFTYGNGTKVYKDINGNEIDGKAIATTKLNGENTSINTKLYKSTILTGNAKNVNDEKWYLNDIGQNNSVATDTDDTIKSRINANNLNTELNYQYVNEGNISEIIDAKSPKIDIKIENTDKEESKYNELPPINCSGLSFGIIERPHVNITLEKKIKNIAITLQNGTTIINGDPNDPTVSKNVAKLTDSNAKLELDSSYLYGSNALVTYTLSARNESEIDYATEDYYKYGDKKDATPVTTIVTKIADYLNNQNASYENKSNNVEEFELTEDTKNKYFSQDVISENHNYKQKVFTTNKALKPVAAVTEEHLDETCTDEYEFTVNNLLSTSDELLGWISYAEIIEIKNITLTPQSVSKSGNYVVGDDSTYEADTAKATISISPSTGENKNLIIYASIGGGLIIIALGVVLIKKFVINEK